MIESFKTNVALDLILDRTDNYDVLTKTIEIVWDLEIDFRSWGLKDVVIAMPDQKVSVFLNIWDDVVDREEEVILDIRNVQIERTCEEFSGLVPKSLEFYDGQWKLLF